MMPVPKPPREKKGSDTRNSRRSHGNHHLSSEGRGSERYTHRCDNGHQQHPRRGAEHRGEGTSLTSKKDNASTGQQRPKGTILGPSQGATKGCLQGLHLAPRQSERLSQSHGFERYLEEGNKEDAGRKRDREGYAYGAAGMSSYLADWQNRWDGMSATGTRKGTSMKVCVQSFWN